METIRDTVPGFTGNISDLGGPTANMWRLACKDPKIESSCRRLSCVYPDICPNMSTDHKPLIHLYRKARALPGIKRVFIASGLRYDLAVRDPEYVKELVTHHVGGYLKIAPEHTEEGPLSKMMKPGIGTYDRFKQLFDKYSKEAGKEQYLIPYFISAHPGTTDEDMLNLALWLKRNGFRPDQVQAFLPTPLAIASAMYHTGLNPLKKIKGQRRRAGIRGIRHQAAPPAQGLPALPRPEELAAAAGSAEKDGAGRSDRQRQEAADSGVAAGGHCSPQTGEKGRGRHPKRRYSQKSSIGSKPTGFAMFHRKTNLA